jgi:hypothetical protein
VAGRAYRDSRLQTHRGDCGKPLLCASNTIDRIRAALQVLCEECGTASRVGQLFREFRFDHQLSVRSRPNF